MGFRKVLVLHEKRIDRQNESFEFECAFCAWVGSSFRLRSNRRFRITRAVVFYRSCSKANAIREVSIGKTRLKISQNSYSGLFEFMLQDWDATQNRWHYDRNISPNV